MDVRVAGVEWSSRMGKVEFTGVVFTCYANADWMKKQEYRCVQVSRVEGGGVIISAADLWDDEYMMERWQGGAKR